MKIVTTVTRIILCLLCCSSIAKAHLADSIPAHNILYQRPNQLFVHTDKHIYTGREYLWFSAALLDLPPAARAIHNLLCIALIPADTRIPAMHQKFAMVDGYSYGSLRLPDTIAPGEYKLVAYTNLIDKDSMPSAVFTKDLTIYSTLECNYIGAVTLLEDGKGLQDLLITVRDKATSEPLRDAELTLWRGSKMIQAKTDKDGVYRQSLHALRSETVFPVVNVKIRYKGEVQYLQKIIPVPEKERQLRLHFYPEGGDLLPNVLSKVGWQAITDQGEPVPVKTVLYKNQQAIDTVVTDEWGMGHFLLMPEAGASYSMKVVKSPPDLKLQAAGYALPAVLNKGFSMHVSQAVTGDTLELEIWSAGYSTIRMMVHNFQQVFVDRKYQVENRMQTLLLLNHVPKGLAAITLLDEKNRPVAERIFFAHYNENATVDIRSDKKEYGKRQKVTLTLQLTNQRGIADSGLATISCVQANRMLPNRQQDIESWSYLEAPLQHGMLLNKRYSNTTWMENILLLQEGRQWNAQPTNSGFFSPVITGDVFNEAGRVKKQSTITILGSQAGVSAITTDAGGQFKLKYDELFVLQDRKLMISANKNSRTFNRVVIQDPFESINRKLAGALDFRIIDAGKYAEYAFNLFTKDFTQAKQLAAVTVTAKLEKKELLYTFGENLCGDYVCRYNVLNCPNHPGEVDNRAPEEGKTYSAQGGHGYVRYWGCAQEGLRELPRVLLYDGIKIGNQFQPEDFSAKTSANPEYISTLYFSPVLVFDGNGKAECSFYTSDITGPFRIVVNGMTGNNFFYGTTTIEVK